MEESMEAPQRAENNWVCSCPFISVLRLSQFKASPDYIATFGLKQKTARQSKNTSA